MAGASFEVALREDIDTRLARLAEVTDDLTPLMDEIGMAMVTSTQLRFESGTGPDGSRWLSSARAEAEGGQTLVKDGHLKDSISHNADADGVEWGSSRKYAAIHQYGGDIMPKSGKALVFQAGSGVVFARKVTMPARPYLGLSVEDEQEIEAIAEYYMAEALGENA